MTGTGSVKKRRHSFEGIIANMDRRYHETDSQLVRDELAKYLSQKPCNVCEGARLNVSARNVFVEDLPIHHLTRFPDPQIPGFF